MTDRGGSVSPAGRAAIFLVGSLFLVRIPLHPLALPKGPSDVP